MRGINRGLAVGVAVIAILYSVRLRAATIPVTNTDDNGPGSLRAALASAGQGDNIDATGISGTILLTHGELVVSKNIAILGPGPTNLFVDGNFPPFTNRVFRVTGGLTNVIIAGLTITNGLADIGGGILNSKSTLTVSNCTISGNSASTGGGIFNNANRFGNARLMVDNCTFASNSAGEKGGGMYNAGEESNAILTMSNCIFAGNSAIEGGGIYNDAGFHGTAIAHIVASTLRGNSASGSSGGGGIFNNGSAGSALVMVINSSISSNSARNINGVGGGILNYIGTVTLSTSTISGNSAAKWGGGIFNEGSMLTVSNCTLSGNSVTTYGGAIYNGSGTFTISGSTLSGNSARFGGGIYNHSPGRQTALTGSTLTGNSAGDSGGAIYNENTTLTLSASTVSGNSANRFGGGIYNWYWALTASNCTFNGNSAGDGGGIFNNDGTLTVSSSTLSSNSANDIGGGIYNFSYGTAVVIASTLSGNSPGGGICNDAYGGSAQVQIGSTILNQSFIANVSGTVTSFGHNLSSDEAGGFLTATGDQINTDPMLSLLQNNGGPTFTHALLPGSPAIDAGDPNFTPPPDFDQRGPGFPRVVNGRIDIGAFELQTNETAALSCSLAPEMASNIVGIAHTVTATVRAMSAVAVNAMVDFSILDGPNAGQTASTSTDENGEASFTYTSNGTPGTDTIEAIATLATLSATGTATKVWIAGCPSITLSPVTLPDGTVGVAYGQLITTAGSDATPLSFAVTAGNLPAGLTLDNAGTLSGTPSVAGTSGFTVTATDTNGCTGSRDYTLNIQPAAGACPDLTSTWSNLTQTCKTKTSGTQCKVKGKLLAQNIGTAHARTSFVRYYLSSDATFDAGDALLKQQATGKIKAGKTKKRTLRAKLPPGNHAGEFVIAVIDADDTVAECAESNNRIVFGPLQ